MYIPSFDFRLFELNQFSPLQAQEFGAETIFGAADPPWFVDRSIDVLNGLGDLRLFQGGQGAEDARERARRALEQAERVRDEAQRVLEHFGGNVKRGAGVVAGVPGNVAKGAETVANAPGNVAKGAATLKAWWDAIPAGAGVFLIGVVALIFLLLFVKR